MDSEVLRSPTPSGEESIGYARELEKLRRREHGESPGEGESLALRFAVCLNLDHEHEARGARTIVAAAGAEVVGETIRLWGAATRPAFRGRGAYGTLVLERCRFGRRLGATLALTKANTATSAPILKRAGFRRFGSERRHVLEIR